MKPIALTARQRRYAEEHHKLIYAFLSTKRLHPEEFYDVVVFGYLRAVRNYLKRPDLRKFQFSTIAWWSMRTEVSNFFRKQKREGQFFAPVSLDEPVRDGSRRTLLDTFPGSTDMEV